MTKIALIFAFLLSQLSTINAQEMLREFEQEWKTDKANKSVDLIEFKAMLPRDAIMPIDSPHFWNRKDAESNYFEHEPVIAISINKKAKAYPLSILMFHEIVNDKLGNLAISATYCPLCNAAIVFNRNLKYKEKEYLLDFGTSGMLRNSDLVMWDRQTETWWQQFTGEGLVGDLMGAQLEFLPAQVISLEDYFKQYPKGKVLSKLNFPDNEKIAARYGKNPYVRYDSIGKNPRLFKGEIDERLPAMERIVDVQDIDRIYPYSIIKKEGVLNDKADGKSVVIFYKKGTVSVLDKKQISESKDIGSITVFSPLLDGTTYIFKTSKFGFSDTATGSNWNITGECISGELKGKKLIPLLHGNHFAFAWFAFHPDTKVYGE